MTIIIIIWYSILWNQIQVLWKYFVYNFSYTVPWNKGERKIRRILNNKINVAQPQKLAIMRLSNLPEREYE